MRPNAVRARMAQAAPAVNAWLSSPNPYAAEVLSYAGFDSVTVDCQHGMFGRDTVLGLLQAISAGPAMPMARPGHLDAAEIGWLLDAGAYGVICPSIDSAADARRLVDACRYPPSGARSFGPGRGLLYGGPDYVRHAEEILVWAMIESRAALDVVDDIAATVGLDGLYVGPNDLALSLGEEPGGSPSEVVTAALERIVGCAHRHGLVAGLFCPDEEEAARWAGLGYDLVTPGNDIGMLKARARAAVMRVRGDGPLTRYPGVVTGGY